jgi:hypothetical protein
MAMRPARTNQQRRKHMRHLVWNLEKLWHVLPRVPFNKKEASRLISGLITTASTRDSHPSTPLTLEILLQKHYPECLSRLAVHPIFRAF